MNLNRNHDLERAGEDSAESQLPAGAANADVFGRDGVPGGMVITGPSGVGKSLRPEEWERVIRLALYRGPRDFSRPRAGVMSLDVRVRTTGCPERRKAVFIARSLNMTLEIPFREVRTRSAISAVQQVVAAFRGAQHKVEAVEVDQRLCNAALAAHCRSLGLELKPRKWSTGHGVPVVWARA